LAIETGMRRGEMLSLKWCDIDLARRVIHLGLNWNVSSEMDEAPSRWSGLSYNLQIYGHPVSWSRMRLNWTVLNVVIVPWPPNVERGKRSS
jgi:integrase